MNTITFLYNIFFNFEISIISDKNKILYLLINILIKIPIIELL